MSRWAVPDLECRLLARLDEDTPGVAIDRQTYVYNGWNNGIDNNGVTVIDVVGKHFTKARHYDGINQYTSFPNNGGAYESPSGFDVLLTFWFRPADIAREQRIINNSLITDLAGYFVGITAAGKLRFQWRTTGGADQYIEYDIPTADEWYQATAFIGGGGTDRAAYLFVEGESQELP